mmetsp:Transcript_15941/g.34516  ORF Transcript_15941/g.34516 Transcript_15941/m.34516 type:complete len:207 (+) Transcript_15941:821-1441(+)
MLACFKLLITLKYESCNPVYFPTMTILTSFSNPSNLNAIRAQSVILLVIPDSPHNVSPLLSIFITFSLATSPSIKFHMVDFASNPPIVKSKRPSSDGIVSNSNFSAKILCNFCSINNKGTWYTLLTSCTESTASDPPTWQKLAILIFVDSSSTSLQRQKMTVGLNPTLLKSLTPCCVGLVFCSSPIIGTRDTKVRQKLEGPTRNWN